MTDALFPALADMQTMASWVGALGVYGIGLSIVFWTLGYLRLVHNSSFSSNGGR